VSDGDVLGEEASTRASTFLCEPTPERREQIRFGDLFTIELSPDERERLKSRARVDFDSVPRPDLPVLRRSSRNTHLAADIAKLRVPGRQFVDFLAGINRNMRNMAAAWLAIATMVDDLKLGEKDDDLRAALDRALDAQAASTKLIAVAVADAVAAVHASNGNSAEFVAILRGLQGEVTPPFVTASRFATLREAAADVAVVDDVRKNVLRLAHPNSSKERKRGLKRSRYLARGSLRGPRWTALGRDEQMEEPQRDSEGTDHRMTKAERPPARRPFRGRGHSHAKK
jgi:hypothetical protein